MADDARVVGVYPPEAVETHARLLDALSCAVPLSFRGFSDGMTCDAIVSFAGSDSLAAFNSHAKPCFVSQARGQRSEHLGIVLSNDEALDSVLRGRAFEPESNIDLDEIKSSESDRILAESERGPFWIRRDADGVDVEVTAAVVPELSPDEVLRDRLSPARCMATLPLFHFLRDLTREVDWQPPPLRACFIIDDPNLHTMSYGFIRFQSLAKHAATHNYHVSSAMIPLDGWYVNGRAAQFFRDQTDQLSLLIHGNNHSTHELAQAYSETDGVALAAQALRRIARFESRSGLSVARVMVAPHGKWVAPVAAAMSRVGFDAMCHSRPFPWIKRLPPDVPMAGMAPAQWNEEGLPSLPRFSLEASETEVVLRAFLGQPVIMLGHHWDAVNDYGLFEKAAGIVNSLGNVRWMDMEAMAQSNYAWKREGAVLSVRAYSKILSVDIPEGVEAVEVEAPALGGEFVCSELDVSGVEPKQFRENGVIRSAPVKVSGDRCRVQWRHVNSVDPATLQGPATSWRHIARRLATEVRDRCQPLTGR
jgi:hypothetical protein